MSFLSNLRNRQTHGRTSRQNLRHSLLSKLNLDDSRRFKIHRNQHVTSINLDAIEQRYALVATGLGNIQLFDLHSKPSSNTVKKPTASTASTSTASTASTTPAILTPLSSMPREHCRMISSVQWYPVDTGLFISACRNGKVNLWDTNSQQVVWKLDVGTPVNDAAMSPIAKEHMLIAVAAQDSTVRLCDPRSGNSTHIFSGHASEVASLSWSPCDPFTLVSAGHDSGIRIWDIRRSGATACTMALDQHRTLATTANDRDGNGNSSSNSSNSSNSSKGTKGTIITSRTTSLAPSFSSSFPSSSRPHKRQRLDDVQAQVRRSACMAHNGKVTCIEHTPDGRYLVSAGTDNQMRCWNLKKNGINTLTHYTGFTNSCPMKSWMLVMQPSNVKSPIVVHPTGTRDGKDGAIGMYDMLGGQHIHTLDGHWERSNCGCYVDNGGEMEILTGGADGNVMSWRYCKIDDNDNVNEKSDRDTTSMASVWGGAGGDEDNWSD